jgi:hypothetical protein
MSQPVPQKKCSQCGEVKPLDDFYRDGRTGDGHRADCKTCSKKRAEAYKSRYDAEHPGERVAYMAQWREDNREHYLEQRREYRERKREEIKRQQREWREANREYLREKERQHREELRTKVFDHYGRVCACCGSTESPTIDHINGGGTAHRLEVLGRGKVAGWVFYRWLVENDFPEGFQVLCFPCNQSKCNRDRCRLDHSRGA